jgi:glycerol-3-phosphate O-acyltransferase
MSEAGTSRVAAVDFGAVLRDESFRADLRQLAEQQRADVRDLERYARKCFDEMAVRPADRYLAWTARLARFMITRSFEPQLDVNADAIEALARHSGTRQLVFLWSHKSHLDSFVFMRALYDAGFTPQPLVFAGVNMNFAAFGPLVRHSGAVFLRRTFREDLVYKLVFRHFVDYLLERRVPMSWSIEGTRSRIGKLLPPRLGLLHWVVDACLRSSAEDALFVPVAISFDQIPEIDDYIAMQHGLPKRKESLKWFIDYIGGMKADCGKIYVRFAEPIALRDFVGGPGAGRTDAEPGIEIQKLALEVCRRIECANPINLTDLVTLILLAANGRAVDQAQIRRHALEIIALIRTRRLPTAPDLLQGEAVRLETTLDALTKTDVLQRSDKGGSPVYTIKPGHQLAAAYYRNTIVNYFLNNAVAEVALATAGDAAGESLVLDASIALRDLLRFEFIFKARQEFRADVMDYLDHRYPGWREGKLRIEDAAVPLFGHAVLRSFIEAYAVIAIMLQGRGSRELRDEDRDALLAGSLEHGEELLLRREISTESALSQPLFETALRLASHRQLLTGDAPLLGRQRGAFVAEIRQVLAAINRLQDAYDAMLGKDRIAVMNRPEGDPDAPA